MVGLPAAAPDRVVDRFQTRKAGALLAHLALDHNRALGRDTLYRRLIVGVGSGTGCTGADTVPDRCGFLGKAAY